MGIGHEPMMLTSMLYTNSRNRVFCNLGFVSVGGIGRLPSQWDGRRCECEAAKNLLARRSQSAKFLEVIEYQSWEDHIGFCVQHLPPVACSLYDELAAHHLRHIVSELVRVCLHGHHQHLAKTCLGPHILATQDEFLFWKGKGCPSMFASRKMRSKSLSC